MLVYFWCIFWNSRDNLKSIFQQYIGGMHLLIMLKSYSKPGICRKICMFLVSHSISNHFPVFLAVVFSFLESRSILHDWLVTMLWSTTFLTAYKSTYLLIQIALCWNISLAEKLSLDWDWINSFERVNTSSTSIINISSMLLTLILITKWGRSILQTWTEILNTWRMPQTLSKIFWNWYKHFLRTN